MPKQEVFLVELDMIHIEDGICDCEKRRTSKNKYEVSDAENTLDIYYNRARTHFDRIIKEAKHAS